MHFGHLYVFFEGMFVYTLCLLFYGIVYLTQRCMSYLHILEIIPLLFVCLQIFPLILWVVFLFMVSFAVGKLLTLIKGHLFIFVFIFITPGGGSKTILLKGKKYCCNLCQTVFCLGFPLRVLESLALHFSLWSNLRLFLCVVLENVLNSLFPM